MTCIAEKLDEYSDFFLIIIPFYFVISPSVQAVPDELGVRSSSRSRTLSSLSNAQSAIGFVL